MASPAHIPDDLKARVFLSCGQRDGELKAAQELGRILEDRGFAVYIARQQASLEGVKEAIFPQLRDADYLLFVDFPRDSLVGGGCRGSLFSHQELAIASFLNVPYIGFRHCSVRREGLSDFVLSNVAEFGETIELPHMLREELKNRSVDWNPTSRRRLVLSRPDAAERSRADSPLGHFFHLNVRNQHKAKMAVNCMAYVEEITDSHTKETVQFNPAELKWAGTTWPAVPIMPDSARSLDACVVLKRFPRQVLFSSFSDSWEYMAPLVERDVDVAYVVLSENFPPARCTLHIEPGQTPEESRVYEV